MCGSGKSGVKTEGIEGKEMEDGGESSLYGVKRYASVCCLG